MYIRRRRVSRKESGRCADAITKLKVAGMKAFTVVNSSTIGAPPYVPSSIFTHGTYPLECI